MTKTGEGLPNDEPVIQMLIKHCRMYFYAANGPPIPSEDEIPNLFFTFGIIHLTCSMFIIDSGIFHRVLDPIGKGHLLDDIDGILQSKVGETTLGEFIRLKRNRLVTHRLFKFSDQPREIQDVTFSDEALLEFESASQKLETAVADIHGELCRVVEPQDQTR